MSYEHPFTVVIQKGKQADGYHVMALTIKRAVEQAKAQHCPDYNSNTMRCYAAAGHHSLADIRLPALGWRGFNVDGIAIDELENISLDHLKRLRASTKGFQGDILNTPPCE